jgi:hypothetical protein
MSRHRFEELQKKLHWTLTTQGSDKELHDSQGVSYAAKSKASLLIRPRGGNRTEFAVFYLVENEYLTGGHHILLAKSCLDMFSQSGQNASKMHPAAPTEIVKGKTRKG